MDCDDAVTMTHFNPEFILNDESCIRDDFSLAQYMKFIPNCQGFSRGGSNNRISHSSI